MIVRGFRLGDYIKIKWLLQEVLSKSCYQETIEALARQLSWDSELVLVAVAEHQLVGVIIGTIDRNKGYFYRIAVDPNHQRKGIGRLLVSALQQRFLRRKVSRILITVDLHNEPILPLYESVGYSTCDFSRTHHRLSIVSG